MEPLHQSQGFKASNFLPITLIGLPALASCDANNTYVVYPEVLASPLRWVGCRISLTNYLFEDSHCRPDVWPSTDQVGLNVVKINRSLFPPFSKARVVLFLANSYPVKIFSWNTGEVASLCSFSRATMTLLAGSLIHAPLVPPRWMGWSWLAMMMLFYSVFP